MQRFVRIGEGRVQILLLSVCDVDSLRMTVTAIPEMYPHAIPTSPRQESTAVHEYLLIDDLEGQVLVLRVVHQSNPRWRAQ